MVSKINLGKIGEETAVGYLKEHGYKILERNFSNKLGEIDIIAKEGDVICFVEVKTRQSTFKGTPFEAVTRQKQAKLVRVAFSYLKSKGCMDCSARFDVVGIMSPASGPQSIELVTNAIDLSNMKYR